MADQPKCRGGKRPGSGRKPKNPDEPLVGDLFLRLTRKQSDYLVCIKAVGTDPQDHIRELLNERIDELERAMSRP